MSVVAGIQQHANITNGLVAVVLNGSFKLGSIRGINLMLEMTYKIKLLGLPKSKQYLVYLNVCVHGGSNLLNHTLGLACVNTGVLKAVK